MSDGLIVVGVLFVVIVCFGIMIATDDSVSNEERAYDIIDLRTNEEISCDKLKSMYVKYEKLKYDSFADSDWFNEIRKKLVSQECITKSELQNLEYIEICHDSDIVDCHISRIENPELYENFTGVFSELDVHEKIRNVKGRG